MSNARSNNASPGTETPSAEEPGVEIEVSVLTPPRDVPGWEDIVLGRDGVILARGGNLLLNVGPTARGTFDYRAQERLQSMGEWMKVNGRSIYGCTEPPAGITAPEPEAQQQDQRQRGDDCGGRA